MLSSSCIRPRVQRVSSGNRMLNQKKLLKGSSVEWASILITISMPPKFTFGCLITCCYEDIRASGATIYTSLQVLIRDCSQFYTSETNAYTAVAWFSMICLFTVAKIDPSLPKLLAVVGSCALNS